MKLLRVGIFDSSFRGFDASITHGGTLPPTLEYIDFPRSHSEIDACDVLLATTDMARLLPMHPCRVLWLPENREFQPHPPAHVMAEFDLVLTNDLDLVRALPGKAKWLSLIGTWIRAREDAPKKTRSVSFLASAKAHTSGHKLRHEVAALHLIPERDSFGAMFGKQIATKDEALWPYRFSVVIEPASYSCLVTEKLCDAFAAGVIPIYWGPRDLVPLGELGFCISAITPWETTEDLKAELHQIEVDGEGIYEQHRYAIEMNQRVVRELFCTEILLERILREHFCL